jgi:starvation-inducible outer membrane lipoprotein
MRNLLFTKETGTYQLNGNSLTLIPQKGYIQAWTKGSVVDSTGRRSETDNWGKLVSTQPTKLEKVTYQISKQYFSGIQEWQLVMQAVKPTERDGPFTANAAFPNSWLYGTQKFPIVPPQ